MSDYLPVINRWMCGKIVISDILYIVTNYRKAEIHTRDSLVTVYVAPREIEAYLDGRFRHCLKHLIVNFDAVDHVEEGMIFLDNGEKLRLGYHSYIRVKQNFAMYISNRKKLLANV